jgi:DNA mismatch endonuclease (patch repair protein)
VDTVSPEVRSRVMSKVLSCRNRSTEWRVRAALIRGGLKGWKLNPCYIRGKPDFAFPIERVAVFVDGCFWHGCPRCKRVPSSNVAYWRSKIERNRFRDRAASRELRRDGWQVIRVWEHQLKSTGSLLKRIRTCLDCAASRHDGVPRLPSP